MLPWRARAKPLGVGRQWLIIVLCVRVAFAKFGLSVLYSYRSTYGELLLKATRGKFSPQIYIRGIITEGYEGKIFPFS